MSKVQTRGAEFADLVHQVLVMEERFDMRQIAEACGMAYDTFYSRVCKRVVFSAEEIRNIIRAAPDPRFAAYILSGTRFVPAERTCPPGDTGEPFESIRRTAILMLIEASEVADAIEEALCDSRIDHREAQVIQNEIDAAERAVATVREHVRQFAASGVGSAARNGGQEA